MELVLAGQFGRMPALKGNEIATVPIEAAVSKLKTVDQNLYELAKVFFG